MQGFYSCLASIWFETTTVFQFLFWFREGSKRQSLWHAPFYGVHRLEGLAGVRTQLGGRYDLLGYLLGLCGRFFGCLLGWRYRCGF